MASRSQIMSAIETLIQGMTFSAPINGKTTWTTVGLRLKLWGDVPPALQPAAYLVTHNESYDQRGLGVERRQLNLGIWCYSRTDDPSINGQTDLDTMMAAFEAAFDADRPDTMLLTLGGLVEWCQIRGRVFKDPGDIDNQAMLIVPIVVELP